MTEEDIAETEEVSEEIEHEDPPEGGFFNAEESEGEPENEAQAPDAESIARARGWKPPTEWKGAPPPGGLIETPEEFNQHYESFIPRLKQENEQLQKLVSEFEGMRQKLEERDKREREREIQALRQELNNAVRAGDEQAANQVLAEFERQNTQAEQPDQGQTGYDANNDPNFKTWIADNAWYDQRSAAYDPQRAQEADRIAHEVVQAGYHPQKDGMAFYREIERRVNQRLPASTSKNDGVEGARRPASRKPAKKIEKWSDLPRSVRDDQFTKQMVDRFYGGDRDKYARDKAEDFQ